MPESDVDLRARIVRGAADAYRATDFHQVGPAEVAAHAGVTVDEVRRAFPSWDLLVVAVVDRWSNGGRRATWSVAERHGAVAYLRARLEDGQREPGLVRLRIALLSAASAPGHPASGWFRHQYTSSFEDVALALVRDVVAGRETRDTSPRHAAEQLVALFEGLQLQAMLLDGTDLLAGWDRAVARMRAGWAGAAVTA